ncbi:MAG TPA: hypothetical protein VJ184_00650 [Chryseolinea sp.]|nr:hypothetical protein [Chryseolinea sp.]
MIRHIWSVLCQSASFDAQTNNVSLQNILESIIVFGEPDAAHPAIVQAEIVSLWARGTIDVPAIGQMQAYYIDPNGNQAPPITLELNLSQGVFHRTRINIPGLPLIAKGEYIFRVEYQLQGDNKWVLAATIPLLVLTQQPAQQ